MSQDSINFIGNLQNRGLVHQHTPDLSDEFLAKTQCPAYVGFDPSAASLHAGSLMPLLAMDRYRREGLPVIMVFGGATGLIGDPSGKDQERTLESEELIRERVELLQKQAGKFFGRTDGGEVRFVNNIDWYKGFEVLPFLRAVGKHFSVNQLIARDSIKDRLENREQGISYTEFSYALLQAYDYQKLYETHGCRLQMGASDQWGNIVSGIDLIRRQHSDVAHGLTLPLLTNSQGKKYGKTEKGAVWLDPELTSEYDFYQFWLRVEDADVVKILTWFTDFNPEDIAAWENEYAPESRELQKRLAKWLCARLHGAEVTELVEHASAAVFSKSAKGLTTETAEVLSKAIPTARISKSDYTALADIMIEAGAVKSKSEVKRLIAQGGISANGDVISDLGADLRDFSPSGEPILLGKGKAGRYLVLFTD